MTVQGKSFTASAVRTQAVDLLNKAGHLLRGEPEINIGDTPNSDECKGQDSLTAAFGFVSSATAVPGEHCLVLSASCSSTESQRSHQGAARLS